MVTDLIFAIWFLIPAAVANVVPIVAAVIPGLKQWNAPIDGGHKFRGKAILGLHKTWRGLLVGVALAGVAFSLQILIIRGFGLTHTIVGHETVTLPFIFGPAIGFGALAGDAIESFFKRQYGIKSGGSWVPFDQLDYIAGAVLLSLPFVVLTVWQYVWIVLFWVVMHLAFSYLGWRLGLKEAPI